MRLSFSPVLSAFCAFFLSFIRLYKRLFHQSLEFEKEVFFIFQRRNEHGICARAPCAEHIREYLVADNGAALRHRAEFLTAEPNAFSRGLTAAVCKKSVYFAAEKLDAFLFVI